MTTDAFTANPKPLTPQFAAMFALAHIGAFSACLPLLTVLVPLKAAEIAPADTAALLSWTVLIGAGAASLINILGGALSDRTRSRYGRRRPWILGGAVATAASYFFIWRAASPIGLFAGVILFQIAFNFFLPALVALLPDEVPDKGKGRMASFLALGPPIGLGMGAMLAGAESLSSGGRYAALAALFMALIAPLLLFWKEAPNDREPAFADDPAPATPLSVQNFWRVWSSRLFTQIGVATSQGFILLFVAHAMTRGASFPHLSVETIIGRLLLLSTAISLATALLVGEISDRFGSRRTYVAASGALIGAGMATIALFPNWAGVLAGQSLYGVGVGLYSAAEVALAAELLPSRRNSARDLAILNLGNTLPQAIAPIMALLLIQPASGGYSALFMAGALAAAIGGAIALRIRPIS